MRSLENNRRIAIKSSDKSAAIVVWDWRDYLEEAEQ